MAISFVAIVFTGPLESFIERAIGMTLIGAALLAVTGGFLSCYRGTVIHPQDITAVILAVGASAIYSQSLGQSPYAQFASVVLFMMSATLLSGVLMVILG